MAALKVWYDQEADFLEVVFEDAPAARKLKSAATGKSG